MNVSGEVVGRLPAGNVGVNGRFEETMVTNGAGRDMFGWGTAGLRWMVEWCEGFKTFGGQTRPDRADLELDRGVSR